MFTWVSVTILWTHVCGESTEGETVVSSKEAQKDLNVFSFTADIKLN